jgi:uncharacterized radical SAM superfamily Fe-S cluster-containing enzyme
MPEGIDIPKLLSTFVRGGDPVSVMASFHYGALLIGAMHFMDPYNMDLERVRSCGIHYATPDGRVIPFCTYNTLYREGVEKKFASQAVPAGARSASSDRPAVPGLQ